MSIFGPGSGTPSPLTTKGDIWGYGGNANNRVPVGADNLFLKADSSVTLGISWSSPTSAAASITTLAGAVTVGTNVDQIFVSGAGGGYTITFANAASVVIKPFRITRTDDTIGNPIIINAVISGSTNWNICTKLESFTFFPDGTNWNCVDHSCAYSGTYTPAVAGLSVYAGLYSVSRFNNFLEIDYSFGITAAPAALAAISLPGNLTIDSGLLALGNTTSQQGNLVGHWTAQANNQSGYHCTATGTTNTQVFFGGGYNGAVAVTPQNAGTITGANQVMRGRFKVPIFEFKP